MNQFRTALLAAIASAAIIGCAGKGDAPTSPVSSGPAVKPASQLMIAAARSTLDSCQAPGETIALGPAVLVTDSGGVPVGNELVTFELLSGSGSLQRGSATTDAHGLATAGAWTLGAGSGVNAVQAFLAKGDKSKAVYFSVSTANVSTVVAVFQLTAMGGQPLPQGNITGGHYYLGANGTFVFGYELYSGVAPATICSSARFVVASPTIDFYLAPGSYPPSSLYAPGAGLFATGTLSAFTLLVKYVDTIDFADETYTLVSGSVAPPAVSR
jgi:hypothetical protein